MGSTCVARLAGTKQPIAANGKHQNGYSGERQRIVHADALDHSCGKDAEYQPEYRSHCDCAETFAEYHVHRARSKRTEGDADAEFPAALCNGARGELACSQHLRVRRSRRTCPLQARGRVGTGHSCHTRARRALPLRRLN